MARPRKPTKLKLLEGNRGKRKIRPEPQPASGAPTPPAWFGRIAREVWNSTIPELDRLGLISKIDGPVLEGFCLAYETVVECTEILAAKGKTMIVGLGGYEQQRPEVSMRDKAMTQLRMFAGEIGASGAARSKFSVTEAPKQTDPVDAAIFGS